ncbi:sensor histidine kinase [Psychroserpens ponticola]|uniref:Histidine kinase n=1 Tax=Psychroserpens ponticola TaxID=2932268 RepID=A0ABY7RTL8_9FLAO|nr:histidine kinase [Psychroserpens ponticola]WCO00444.1 histidine kinase [Psychroserpens ponticola]
MFTKQFILKKIGQIILHLLFWVGVLFFYTYFFGVNSSKFEDTLLFSLCLMPTTIATTYVSTYKLIPDYLVTKQYWRFALYSLYTLIISVYLLMVSIFFSLIYISNFEYDEMNPATKNIIFICTAVYLVVVIVSAFKLLKLNLKQASETKALETKILDTQLKLKEQELNYLKMQIHPHFLFNTLNTMYGFALKKAEQTPDMILKLSNLLDYLLYQAEKPFVLLSEEIAHIKDYIDLEKMRFNDTLQVNFNIEVASETTSIAPMLLLPFIENSFKHGSIVDGKLTINIQLTADTNSIDFSIQNSNSKNYDSQQGIGLDNIQKRLELLYANQYQLNIKNQENQFSVQLQLKTVNHD